MAEDQLQQLIDIEAIKELKAQYCVCVANEDWDTFFTLFAEDLEFVMPQGDSFTSRSAFYDVHKISLQDPKVWGVVRCFTPIITITGSDRAKGHWAMEDVHVWPPFEGPRVGHHGYGHYHEDYIRSGRLAFQADRSDLQPGGCARGRNARRCGVVGNFTH